MKELKFSSDPYSDVNRARYLYWIARRKFGQARKPDSDMTFSKVSKVMAAAKRHLKAVAYEARGQKYTPPERYHPEDHTYDHFRIQGIPCLLVLTYHVPAEPASQCEPPVMEEVEWVVTDDRGYRMRWLEKKMTKEERREADEILLKII